MAHFFIKAVGSLGGAGLSPVMPGTVGSILTAGVLLVLCDGPASGLAWWGWALLAVAVSILGFLFADLAARRIGKDPQWFVLDEAAGVMIAFVGQRDLAPTLPSWLIIVVCLFFFRLFDILKPWPVRQLEGLPRGAGIMMDDIAAGLLAWPCALGVLWVLG